MPMGTMMLVGSVHLVKKSESALLVPELWMDFRAKLPKRTGMGAVEASSAALCEQKRTCESVAVGVLLWYSRGW